MDDYFSGSFKDLFNYWQKPDRAKKFTKGGTREGAIRYLLDRAEVEIHKGVWVDTAVGAGYIQSQLYDTVSPNLMIGIDFSRSMLEYASSYVEPILGSAFNLPLRNEAANIATNIFCLSDYPDPSSAFQELARIVRKRGVIMFMDYSDQDGYWTIRQKYHDKDGVIGNIHLRNPKSIEEYLPVNLRIIQNLLIEYEADTSKFDERIPLPKQLNRVFLFVEMYKPRSD